MSELPEGWSIAHLGDMASSITYGFTTASTTGGAQPKLLRITDIQDGVVNWDTVPRCTDAPDDRALLGAGDIVIARTGATTGKSYLIGAVPEKTVFASYLIRVRLARQLEPRFAWAFMQSNDYWSQIQTVSKGTAQPGANASILSGISLPIPPLPEQRRIVEKIDSLTAKSKRARNHLDHVTRLAEKYKRAVLAAVFRGDLTNVPMGSPCPLSSVVSLRTGPFGSALHKSDYVSNGVPLVNPMHIVNGQIVVASETGITDEKAQSLAEFRLKEGDVVLARRGVMGRCAVVTGREVGFMCGTGSMIVRPGEGVDPQYLQRYLSSPSVVAALEEGAVGTTMVNLNQSTLLRQEIPLASVADQREAVKRIDDAFAWIDRLAAETVNARKLIDHLDQMVLAKAFRGELVPQDPADEPASTIS